MKKTFGLILLLLAGLGVLPPAAMGKDLPKIAVWDLTYGDIKAAYAQDLTLILVSEISRMGRYEVYSQENVRTLAGWTEERMKLGTTNTQTLTALGKMDIAKLISGRVGKIGNRYSVSLNLFDTQNARSEKAVSEFCRSEDELIELVQTAVKKLLGVALEKPLPAPSPALPPPPAVSQRSDPGNLAANPAQQGFPSPLESDRGWGGGNRPWQLVDGERTYPGEWARGLAFTGGVKKYGGQSCGWRQATIDFGAPRAFGRVVLWHHGPEHVPNTFRLQYWTGGLWMDLFSTTGGKNYLKYKDASPSEWWSGWSAPVEVRFPKITSSKVRFWLNNCDIEHGWIYEFEVYED